MNSKENRQEYMDPTIAEVANLMASQICKEVGYDAPDLIARPLRILGEAMNEQLSVSVFQGLTRAVDGMMYDRNGNPVGLHNFLTKIMSVGGLNCEPVELVTHGLGALARPSDEFSLISRVINGLSSDEDGYSIPFPIFDVVNSKVLKEKLGFDESTFGTNKPAEIFNRFTVAIGREPGMPRSSMGEPRVTVTNSYGNDGHHFSMKIEIPVVNGGYKKVFDLLIGRTKVEEDTTEIIPIEDARRSMKAIRNEPLRLMHDSMMELAIEGSQIAVERGFYPYGSAFLDFDGSVYVARNNTYSDDQQERHAEVELTNNLPQGARGYLYGNMEPCPSCAQKVVAKPNIVGLCYALEQTREWKGIRLALAESRLRNNPDFFTRKPKSVPMALEIVKRANGESGPFTGKFKQTYRINRRWYRDYLKKKRKKMNELATVYPEGRFLNPDWMPTEMPFNL